MTYILLSLYTYNGFRFSVCHCCVDAVCVCAARSISERLRRDQGHDDGFPGEEAHGRVRVRVHAPAAGFLVPENLAGVSVKDYITCPSEP